MNFVDSNVILYSLLAEQEPAKHIAAIELLKSQDFIISTQVIGEVAAVLTRKTSLPNRDIRRIADDLFLRYPVMTIERNDMLEALTIRDEYLLLFWDSLIVSAALRSDSTILYSEDMPDGLLVRGRLTIRNPFKSL